MDGESRNFEAWYSRNYGSVLAALVLYCAGDHAQAEDATNDGFVAAFESWQSASVMESPVGWVVRTAINSAKRRFRRRARGIELLNSQRIEVATSDVHRDLDVLSVLAKLPERQRVALVLRYVEDLSQVGVADHMGVAIGTASATLTQARQRFRNSLEESETT